jgi:GNAT superfamily N-acetyltransferase
VPSHDAIEIRPFNRADREQVTALVNAHAAAVLPGASVSVNTVLSRLEREPGEFIVDPWVVERATLVAVQRDRVVAAAHLHRFGDRDDVGETYRDAGDIRWFLFWPLAPVGSPYWPDATDAADALMAACIRQLERWGVSRQYAGCELPAPAAYGVTEQWPHIQAAYVRAGFAQKGHTEIVFLATLDEIRRLPGPPLDGLAVRRSVGINGTRLSAMLGDVTVGYVEVEILDERSRLPRHGGLADVGNLHVVEEHRRLGVATWLLGQTADWLRLAGVDRLLDYAWPEQTECIGFLEHAGFRELTRTARGWVRDPGA